MDEFSPSHKLIESGKAIVRRDNPAEEAFTVDVFQRTNVRSTPPLALAADFGTQKEDCVDEKQGVGNGIGSSSSREDMEQFIPRVRNFSSKSDSTSAMRSENVVPGIWTIGLLFIMLPLEIIRVGAIWRMPERRVRIDLHFMRMIPLRVEASVVRAEGCFLELPIL